MSENPTIKASIKPEIMEFLSCSFNVKRLETIYKIKIVLPAKGGSSIVIKGPPEMVSSAKKVIDDCSPNKTSFFIENEKYIDEILNKSVKEALMKAHSVVINIGKPFDPVKITGKKKGREAAKKAIESLMKNAEAYEETFVLTEEHMNYFAKDGYSSLTRIECHYCVSVELSVDVSSPSSKDERYEIMVKGPSCKRVSDAKERILNEHPHSIIKNFLFFEPNDMKLVTGYKMFNLKRLEKIHKVKLTVEENHIVFEGPAEMVFAAQKVIKDYPPYKMSFSVPNEKYIDVVLSDSVKETIMKEHNVVIKNCKYSQTIEVSGKKSGCEAAKKTIESLMKNAEDYQESFFLTEDQMEQVAKDDFSIFKLIERRDCVSVFMDVSEDERYEIVVKGPSAERVSDVKDHILKNFLLPVVDGE